MDPETDQPSTATTSGDDISVATSRCPGCDYDLSGTLEFDDRRCPECGRTWTIDELALQQVAGSVITNRTSLILWMFGPGWLALMFVFLGVMFGQLPIVLLAFLLAAALVLCLAVFNWVRDLYRVSFAHGRSRFNRFVFVAGGAGGIMALNLLEFVLLWKLVGLLLEQLS